MNDTQPPPDFNQRVGANLRALRAITGLSQTQLAEAMSARGYSWQQQTVLKIEKGARPLRFEEADALTSVFGCTLEDVRARDLAQSAFWELSKVEGHIEELELLRKKIDDELAADRKRAWELSNVIVEANSVER